MKYLIFVAAYFAEATLEKVIRRVPRAVYDDAAEILIQDDASADRTFQVAEHLARDLAKVTAIRNETNLGFGGTHKKAFSYAIAKGYEAVVVLHGDGQLAPESLREVMAPLQSGKADIVLGSRILGDARGGGMPLHRYYSNRALTGLTNLILGEQLTDYHTGYAAYTTAALERVDFRACGDGHELTTEILVRASRGGLRIAEVPVSTFYGPGSRSVSMATSLKYSLNLLKQLGREVWNRGKRRATPESP